MALYPYPSSSKGPNPPGKTEFEILKASHKFLREEDNKGQASWDDQLATKYYDSLFREYAVCDLKHYKSGNFSLRWRTEAEVLAGAGETTCGNTRCEHHEGRGSRHPPLLTTLELPFAYTEHGEAKSALVKAVLCDKCLKKLMWKRRKEKERLLAEAGSAVKEEEEEPDLAGLDQRDRRSRPEEVLRAGEDEHRQRKRNSRSRSPRRSHKDGERTRRRSPIR
ncbi:folate-sensitive fragile site protein Fra10Ac1-domain-containing protein [Mycena galopus ATCC 62051]|nr:folate-sensitive fragile site protein Fra10Ac1-domain-containing protein [Mycena galopus ATCC 62051]